MRISDRAAAAIGWTFLLLTAGTAFVVSLSDVLAGRGNVPSLGWRGRGLTNAYVMMYCSGFLLAIGTLGFIAHLLRRRKSHRP